MPKLDNRKVSSESWNCLPINTTKKSSCYDHMLQKIYNLMHYCLFRRSRVFVLRVDLKCSFSFDESVNILNSNKLFVGFVANLAKKMRRRENFFYYCWAREESNNEKGHYHIALFYDGSKHRNGYILQNDIKDDWKTYMMIHKNRFVTPLMDRCNKKTKKVNKPTSSYMLIRNEGEGETFKQCFKRLSYLAKEETKRGVQFGNNNRFGSSQTPSDFEVDRTMISYGAKKSIFTSSN